MAAQGTARRETEMEGRVSALEAGQQAIQEDIRELTQVVTDLAHETRRSLSVIQRPNWQYLTVLLGIVIAVGSIYVRDQDRQDLHIKGLIEWQLTNVYEAGKNDGLMRGLSDKLQMLRDDMKDLHGGK